MAVVGPRRPATLATRIVGAALAALLGAGCVTPSIPIPPPEAELMTFAIDTTAGTASFSYDSEPSYADAIVYVFNRTLGSGIITTARPDGSVGPTQPFPAAPTQSIRITFETDEITVGACVVIQADGTAAPFCGQ